MSKNESLRGSPFLQVLTIVCILIFIFFRLVLKTVFSYFIKLANMELVWS